MSCLKTTNKQNYEKRQINDCDDDERDNLFICCEEYRDGLHCYFVFY